MKIGVDVRSLSVPITGIGQYTLELLDAMVDLGHEWVLYSHKPIINGRWDRPNVMIRTMNLKARPFSMIWSQCMLPYLLKNDSIDLFWAPGHRLPLYMSSNQATVVTIHDLVWKRAPETMRKFSRFLESLFMPRAVHKADALIAVSTSTFHDLIEEFNGVSEKISIVHEGIPTLKQNLNSEASNLECIKSPYILFVGTLEPRKNLRRLLEAYSSMSQEIRKNYSLVIAGGKGWGTEKLHTIIKELSIESSVITLGYVTNEDLVNLYKSSSLFVMPSLYEGFGLPILEAMSFGTPVLTSNVSSIPEVTGDAAILINPHDILSIQSGLEKILTDSNLQREMSTKGRIQAQQFSWDVCAKQTLNVFERAFIKHNS